ncbi:LysE family translocator [Pseudomonas sp. JM0905a]|uniref:LysE family translocator n=1 Tax=Pseudomonas sp. JM0905a TaxID=2772484 RepID=UPI0016885A57|nr:LysE family translocator [Pseudomonas sp. JM0905a]MBD2835796.1 LysE family translocator [Pseudomonas sp. JM0905a]
MTGFLIALAVVYLLPGPDMILLLQTGARQGRAMALATALGLALARGCHVALAGLGLAVLFRTAPWTFEVVRLAGAGYLLWLGLKLFQAEASALVVDAEHQPSRAYGQALHRGLLTNLLNPKALVFCSVLLPQFISPDAGPLGLQFALLGAVLVAVGLAFDSVYALMGAGLGRWLGRRPLVQRVQQWLFGGVLVGFGVRLALLKDL